MPDTDEGKALFNFAILTDIHLNELDGPDKFHRAVEQLKGEGDIDFLLLLGDLGCKGSLAAFKNELSACRRPYHVIPGNHDARALTEFEEAFGPLYYTFEYENCLFVGLFNAVPAVDNLHAHHGGLDPDQAKWLAEVLKKADSREPHYHKVFIFAHVPPLQPGSPMHPGFRMTVAATDQIYSLCQEHAVDVCFYGHIHLNEAFEHQGTWHITTPSLNWNFNTCFGYDHKDWLATDYGGYRVVRVFENEISDELRWTHRGTNLIEV